MKAAELFESAKTIDSLYKEFLGRGVDPDGLRYHMQHFIRLGFSKGTQCSVNILMNSDEFQINYNSKKKISFPSGTKLINNKRIEHVISLGNHCLPAIIMKKYGLKKYSTPFDWIFSSPEMVIDCLNDNFTTFMNPIYLKSITQSRKNNDNEPGTSHLLYENKYNLSEIFAHRDITNDNDYSYFVRAIERFNSILRKDDGKIFIMISRPEQMLEKNFSDLACLLNKKTSNFAFYAFQLIQPTRTENKTFASLKMTKSKDSSFLYELTPSVDEGSTGRFDNHLDEAMIISLLSEYNIHI